MTPAITVSHLREFIRDFVDAAPDAGGTPRWWRSPLLVTAGADARFDALPRIAAPDHLLPADLLGTARSVIVYFLPFTRELVMENSHGKFPVRNWGLAYNDTNELIGRINREIASLLERHGFQSAVTPPTANFDKVSLMSRWSHKHLGHLSGLGRFGINAQLITPEGCAGRLGSLVTEAGLGDHPLMGDTEPCRYKRGKDCLKCVEVCPVKAVTVDGIDRARCYQRIKAAQKAEHLADLPEYTETCGKCQALLPCSFSAGMD